jgi:hypothetical protein
MKLDDAKKQALDLVTAAVAENGPPEPRVLHCHAEATWYPDMLRALSEHELSVLGRGTDIIVFFDTAGNVIGWRDDGRKGSQLPAWIDRDAFRSAVVAELDLSPDTRLGRLQPAELPPIGWTHEAVLFLAAVPRPDQIVRVWAAPDTLRVIQCLYGAAPGQEDRP